jgi:hypothetical protein
MSEYEQLSESEKFRQYAEQAMRRAGKCKSEKEKIELIGLACTFTQAAVRARAEVFH